MQVKATAAQLALVVGGSTLLAQCLARPAPMPVENSKPTTSFLGRLNPFHWGNRHADIVDLEQGWGQDSLVTNSALVFDGSTTSRDSQLPYPADPTEGGLLPTCYTPKTNGHLHFKLPNVQPNHDDPEQAYVAGTTQSAQNKSSNGDWSLV